jgi:putative ABC transport system permease protein
MGAGRWRLVRQMLAEALLLAAFGSAIGWGLASLGIRALLQIAPANLPRLDSIATDPSVFAYSAMAGLAAAAMFGIAPALRASRPNVAEVLRAAGRTGGLTRGAVLRNAVVIAEVALSFVLLVGSGLMLRSFVALVRIDPGFQPEGVLAFQMMGGRPARTTPERAAAIRARWERLRAVPGVTSVTAASVLPLVDEFTANRWGKEDALGDASKYQAANLQAVLPGYFETMRNPVLAGRTFTEEDNTPETDSVVVDQVLAAKAFPYESAVGKRILLRTYRKPDPEWVRIVGVVAHQRENSLTDPGREEIFVTNGFFGYPLPQEWALRTKGDPAKYAGIVRSAMSKLDRALLLTEVLPMQTYVTRAGSGTRFSVVLITVFASIAALLAAVGLYGVLSTVVRQRTAEIGVRMAVGATPARVFRLVVGHGMRLTGGGIAAGLLAAFALTRLMTSMLVGVSAIDPETFAAMVVVCFLIAGLATCLPARRAAGLDPARALREE